MIKIDAQNVDFHYGDFHALKNISMQIEANTSVAFIGPSGCGKSTFLRLFNRMNDLIPDTRLEGKIFIDGRDIYSKGEKVDTLRKNVGMVFQKPNPFPKTIFENVAYMMIKHAGEDVPPTPDEWLDSIDGIFSIYNVMPTILELWGENQKTTSIPKKK